MRIFGQVGHLEVSVIGRVAHVPIVQKYIVPGVATHGVQPPVGIHARDVLRMKHDVQQIGIALTNGFLGLKYRIRVIVHIVGRILDVLGNPSENRPIDVVRCFLVRYKLIDKRFDFLVLAVCNIHLPHAFDNLGKPVQP